MIRRDVNISEKIFVLGINKLHQKTTKTKQNRTEQKKEIRENTGTFVPNIHFILHGHNNKLQMIFLWY